MYAPPQSSSRRCCQLGAFGSLGQWCSGEFLWTIYRPGAARNALSQCCTPVVGAPHLRVAKRTTAIILKVKFCKEASETKRALQRFLFWAQRWGARPTQFNAIDAERGTLVCNKYDVLLPNRPAISVAVTLEDLTREAVAAWFGRGSRADHCGLIFVCGLDDGPAHPICWIVRESTLLLVGRQADRSLTEELRQRLPNYSASFSARSVGWFPAWRCSNL